MRAVVLAAPDEFALREVERPRTPAGEALLRVRATTICGTDQKIFAGQFPGTKFPHIPGHEFAGEVVEIGSAVQSVQVGQRVGAEIHVGCGACARCLEGLYQLCLNYGRPQTGHAHIGFTRSGGLAEYVAVPARALHPLPDLLSWNEGAFTDNIGIALYAVERGRLKAGERVAVVGAGAFGALAAQVARALGAGHVTLIGTRAERLERLRGMADVLTTDVSAVQQADLVIEFAGTPDAARTAIGLARRGGRVVLAGATGPGRELSGVDLSTIVRGHLDVLGSLANPYGISARALQLMSRGAVDVKPLITHEFALSDFRTAWQTFVERRDGAIRVMLHP
jgi:L-iditol 2-dehydrogenase